MEQNQLQTLEQKSPHKIRIIGALIVVAVVVSLATSGAITASSDRNDPDDYYSQIFEEGYQIGLTEGENAGLQEGYANGTQLGHQDGYLEGNESGYAEGFDTGYLKGLKEGAGTGYTLRDPSYQEMLNFIAEDKTDEHPYNVNDYNCYDFTKDVCNNASAQGIRIGDVYLEFPDSAHAIVCFNTTDRGLVFVEPQNDKVVSLEIGQHYFDRTLFKTPEYDDTVVSYGIIW
jgi:hypothetical protein